MDHPRLAVHAAGPGFGPVLVGLGTAGGDDVCGVFEIGSVPGEAKVAHPRLRGCQPAVEHRRGLRAAAVERRVLTADQAEMECVLASRLGIAAEDPRIRVVTGEPHVGVIGHPPRVLADDGMPRRGSARGGDEERPLVDLAHRPVGIPPRPRVAEPQRRQQPERCFTP